MAVTALTALPTNYLICGAVVSDVGMAGRLADSVRVCDGKIVEVGTDLVRVPSERVVNLGGRYLSPGFVDPHTHLELSTAASQMVDVRFPACSTVDDVLRSLSNALDDRIVDGWLVAQANLFWDLKLAEGRYPTLAELDSVSRDVAIVIQAGGHVSVINSKAFELSGVEKHDGELGGFGRAVVERDAGGELTGTIKELDFRLPLPRLSPEGLRSAITAGVEQLYTQHGVTAVGEISQTDLGLRILDDLIADGDVPLRVEAYLWSPGTFPTVEEACAWAQQSKFRSTAGEFNIRGIKIFADGGYTASNAYLLEPYGPQVGGDADFRGRLNLSVDELVNSIRRSRAAGLQPIIHANGEAAQSIVCEAVVRAKATNAFPPVRLEHAGNIVTSPETPRRWREAGVEIVPQPAFLYVGFGDFFPHYLGDRGRRGRFPFRDLMEDGWEFSGSSDQSLGGDPRQTNPLFGMWCSTERKTFLGSIVEPAQRLTIGQALAMHTIWAARALGRGDDLGSIEPGKLADFAILDRDPHEAGPAGLMSIHVDHVLRGGLHVFARVGAKALDVR